MKPVVVQRTGVLEPDVFTALPSRFVRCATSRRRMSRLRLLPRRECNSGLRADAEGLFEVYRHRMGTTDSARAAATIEEPRGDERHQPPRGGKEEPAMEHDRETLEEARRYVRRKRIFYIVLGVWVALCVMWFVIDMTDDSSSIWFYWPMFGSGIAVAITGIVLLGIGGMFGIEWERREIDKYLRRQGTERNP
jgi:hypothetical protein